MLNAFWLKSQKPDSFPKLLASLNLYQHKKKALFINSLLIYTRFWRFKTLTKTIQRLLMQILNFLTFYQHIKIELTLFIPFWDTANFSILRPQWPQPFLTIPTTIFSNHPLVSINLNQNEKTHAFSSFYFKDSVNLKIMQSDWSTAFWPLSEEPYFSQVGGLYKNTTNIIKSLYGRSSEKLMIKFSNKFKKPWFWPIFPIFRIKKISWKIQLCYAQLCYAKFCKR